MKALSKILILIFSLSLMVACSEDDSVGVTPPGQLITPNIPNTPSNVLLWQTTEVDTPTNPTALAELNALLGGQCWVDGDYPGFNDNLVVQFGNKDCNNYTDAIHVAVTFDKNSKRYTLYINSYCFGYECGAPSTYLYVPYTRSGSHSNGSAYEVYVNLGPSQQDLSRTPMAQQTYQVELTTNVSDSDYEDLEYIPFTIWYGDGNLERVVAEVNLKRIR